MQAHNEYMHTRAKKKQKKQKKQTHTRSLDFYSGTRQTRRKGGWVTVSHHKQSLADAGAVVTERHRGERMEGEVTYIFVAGCSRKDLLCNVMGWRAG